jgi:hypothetical protein
MKLIENWAETLWRAWSVRLAAIAGVLAGYLAANPDVTQALLELLPDGPMRTLAAAAVGLFVFSVATGTRIVQQRKRGE